jgi:alpha-tubulin suppressor-like RCC1 family protein
MSAGSNAYHQCAELQDGAIDCWGLNDYVQTGVLDADSQGNVPLPTAESVASGLGQIAAGADSTCATLADRSGVLCWGRWIANGHDTSAATIHGLGSPPFTSLAAGASVACAVNGDGGVVCWGNNTSSALADPDASMTSADGVAIPNAGDTTPALQVAIGGGPGGLGGGPHACALRQSGMVTCWGDNDTGQTGESRDASPIVTFPHLLSLTGILEISAGQGFTCARDATHIWCWGVNDHYQCGQAQAGVYVTSPQPVDVSGITGEITALQSGSAHSCIVVGGSAAMCWGYNGAGQIGANVVGDQPKPVSPTSL